MISRRREVARAARIRLMGGRAMQIPLGSYVRFDGASCWWSIEICWNGAVRMSLPPAGWRVEVGRRIRGASEHRRTRSEIWILVDAPCTATFAVSAKDRRAAPRGKRFQPSIPSMVAGEARA